VKKVVSICLFSLMFTFFAGSRPVSALVSSYSAAFTLTCSSLNGTVTHPAKTTISFILGNLTTGATLLSGQVSTSGTGPFTASFGGSFTPVSPGDSLKLTLTDAAQVPLTFTTSCNGVAQTFYNPGDGRLNPTPGERIVVYCSPNGFDIWGVDNSSKGSRLLTVPLDLIQAGGTDGILIGLRRPTDVTRVLIGLLQPARQQGTTSNGIIAILIGLLQPVSHPGGANLGGAVLFSAGHPGGVNANLFPLGIVFVREAARDVFVVSWFGGPYGGTGQGDFQKTVASCGPGGGPH
jgi:hypothetical protein